MAASDPFKESKKRKRSESVNQSMPPEQMVEWAPSLELPPFSKFEEIAEAGEQKRRELARAANNAEIISSGASGSPVYRSPNPSVPEAKKDQPGNGAAHKGYETKKSSPIKR